MRREIGQRSGWFVTNSDPSQNSGYVRVAGYSATTW